MQYKSNTNFTKTVHYGSDGTGRDTYINVDNGGFESKRPIMKFKSDYIKQSSGPRYISNPQTPKTLHYFCDGSGKDTYIVYFFNFRADEGGLAHLPSYSRPYNYISNLRHYEKIPSYDNKKPDWFQMSQTHFTPFEIHKMNQLSYKQQMLSRKLAQPKVKGQK